MQLGKTFCGKKTKQRRNKMVASMLARKTFRVEKVNLNAVDMIISGKINYWNLSSDIYVFKREKY